MTRFCAWDTCGEDSETSAASASAPLPFALAAIALWVAANNTTASTTVVLMTKPPSKRARARTSRGFGADALTLRHGHTFQAVPIYRFRVRVDCSQAWI